MAMRDELDSGTAIPVGTRVGRYQLLRRLAVGGMAELFIARATGIEGFEKLVALKRILPQYDTNWRFVRMFLQEARLAATLQHPNIVQVYDIGRVRRSYFFTMEFVHGVSVADLLRAVVKRGERLPLEHAILIGAGLAAGLHYAHEKRGVDGDPLGIVHRDVSPSNVLVGYDGSIKLVDFGIAKASSQQQETRPGTLKGKIAYMSPEQCHGAPLDRRSDLFALGVLLYELTTSTRLFNRNGDLAILKQITEEDAPQPSWRSTGYPPSLEAIVLRALRRNREERYATAQEMQAALESFAFQQRIQLSSIALATYLADLFRDELAAWRAAERRGSSLVNFFAELPTTAPGEEVDGEGDEFDRSEVIPAEVLLENGDAEQSPTVTPTDKIAPTRSFSRAGWIIALLLAASIALVGAQRWPTSAQTHRIDAVPRPIEPLPLKTSKRPPPPALADSSPVLEPTVHIKLSGAPRAASVWLDGRPVRNNPLVLPRSERLHHLEVRARGFVAKQIELVPTHDIAIPIRLDRAIHRRRTTDKGATTKRKTNPLLVGPGDL